MMTVTVKLFATLSRDKFESTEGRFASGTRVRDIIAQYDLPDEAIALIFINGRHSDRDSELFDGDVLSLFPPIGGG